MRKFALAAALSLAVASPLAAQTADYDADTVLATVAGEEITLGHVIALVSQLPAQYQQLDDQTLYDGILQQLIDQVAVASTATQDREVDLVMDNQRWSLLSSRVADDLAGNVPEADIEAAYEAAYGNQAPAKEFNASHILVETEDAAKALIADLEGGADFAELAMEKSTGPSGPRGGELGWFGPGMMVPPFEAAVMELEVGAISAPVQTQFGWHVVKLNDRRDVAPPTLEEVRDELVGPIRDRIVREGIEAIKADVEIQTGSTVPAAAIRQRDLLSAE